MDPITLTKTLTAASDNCICASQSGSAGVPLLINGSAAVGGVGVLDTQRRVIITSAGNDAGITFKVIGTADGGAPIKQTVTGAGTGIAATTIDFKTVTSVTPSGNTASTVKVGTNGVGSSPWKNFDYYIQNSQLGLAADTSGTVQYSAEYTYASFDNVPAQATGGTGGATPVANGPDTPVPTAYQLSTLKNKSAAADGEPGITWPFRGWRVTVESGTGSVTLTGIQSGLLGA